MVYCYACLCCRWEGEKEKEVGRDKATGKIRVEVDPKYYRPTEVVSTYLVTCVACLTLHAPLAMVWRKSLYVDTLYLP